MTNDLILIEGESALSVAHIGSFASTPNGLDVLGLPSFRYVCHCCEWLEVFDDANCLVGFAFVDFTDDELIGKIRSKALRNVLEDSEGLLVLFQAVAHPRKQPGPYLPVHLYRNLTGATAFLVGQAISNHDVDEWNKRVIVFSAEK